MDDFIPYLVFKKMAFTKSKTHAKLRSQNNSETCIGFEPAATVIEATPKKKESDIN